MQMEMNPIEIIAPPGKQEIFLIREFNAPRDLVFRTHTDPALFVRWFGCREMTTVIDQFNVKSGERYRYLQKSKSRGTLAFHGVYHEVASPERIVKTLEFEGNAGHAVLETARFETLPGDRTRVTTQSVFQTVAERDALLEAGVKKGAAETFDRLDELLQELKST
jgi:uncharacterized protein YndB with AHSA1/START domain